MTVVHEAWMRFSSWVSGFGVWLFCLNFIFYNLRHEAISRMFEKGLNVPEVESISGHKTASQLFRYAYPDLSYIKKKVRSF